MGQCVSSSNNATRRSSSSTNNFKTQLLRDTKPKWRSDIPLTWGQLRSKRDEFWDTAPAFEGRKEIWDALKLAANALESGDLSLAQAVIDGASITLPTGTLMDCYDVLGNRYQLPVYVLSTPTNLVPNNHEKDYSNPDILAGEESGEDTIIKLRLSTGRDIKMTCKTSTTIGSLKKRVAEKEGVLPILQRWLFSGHLLSDYQHVGNLNIPKGFVIQVVFLAPLDIRHKKRGKRRKQRNQEEEAAAVVAISSNNSPQVVEAAAACASDPEDFTATTQIAPDVVVVSSADPSPPPVQSTAACVGVAVESVEVITSA